MPQPKSPASPTGDAEAATPAARPARVRPASNGHARSARETIDMPELLTALTALKRGDFSVRLPVYWNGMAGKTADAFNEVVELNERMAREFARLRQAVGREGRIGQRASLGDVTGTWADSFGLVNELIADLVQPTSEMARVIGAVVKGDLSQTMAMDRRTDGARVLLVDDHEDTLRSMDRLLRLRGYQVHTAPSVAAALEAAASHSFDLLISDVGLSDGSGMDLMRELRLRHGDTFPGIALSGYGMEDGVTRSHDAGFEEHLTKPVDMATLETAMSRMLAVRDANAS